MYYCEVSKETVGRQMDKIICEDAYSIKKDIACYGSPVVRVKTADLFVTLYRHGGADIEDNFGVLYYCRSGCEHWYKWAVEVADLYK